MPTLCIHTITRGMFIFKGVREPQAVWQVAPSNPTSQNLPKRMPLPQR